MGQWTGLIWLRIGINNGLFNIVMNIPVVNIFGEVFD
jgi:hypothetical protein